jgi:agmatine/peptidylarginine deiminase
VKSRPNNNNNNDVIEKGSIDRRGKGFMIEIHMCVKVAQ